MHTLSSELLPDGKGGDTTVKKQRQGMVLRMVGMMPGGQTEYRGMGQEEEQLLLPSA